MIHLLIDLSYMTGKTSHAGTEFVRYFGSLKEQNTFSFGFVNNASLIESLSMTFTADRKTANITSAFLFFSCYS